jgi:hypothetical protein
MKRLMLLSQSTRDPDHRQRNEREQDQAEAHYDARAGTDVLKSQHHFLYDRFG